MTSSSDPFMTRQQSGERILIVDSSANIAEDWHQHLSAHWQFETAVDAQDAIRHVQSHPPDLILAHVSQLQMGLSPFGLLHHIRQDDVLKMIPVVLLTQRTDEATAIKGLKEGADDYLLTPFSIHELILRLEVQLKLARLQSKARQDPNTPHVPQGWKEHDERLQVALDGARLGAWEWDAVQDTSQADRRTRELLGVDADDPISIAALLQNNISPEDRVAVEAAIALALDPQGTGWYDIAYRLTPRGQEERWVHFTGQTIFEGEGAERRAVRMFGTVRDVTDMKRAEAAQQKLSAELAWQGRRFDAIADAAEDAIYTFDPSGRVTYANRRLLTIWQKTLDQAVGKTLWELDYPSEEAARITRQVEQVVATRQSLRDESRVLDFAGAVAAYEYIITPVINAAGEVEAVAGISRDTTERTRAEKTLQASEARYRNLFEAIETGFCVIEVLFDAADRPVDYRFLEANPAFEGHTGLVNAVGKTARELIPQLEPHWFETYGRVARSGQSERFINEAKPMEGRWFEVYAFPLGNDQVGLLFTDISERQRAEATLRESEARQSLLLTLRDRLSSLTVATDIMAAAAELLGQQLQVNSVVYAEIDAEAEYGMIWSDWTDGTVPSLVGRYRLDDFGVGDLYRVGRIRRTDDIRTELKSSVLAEYEPLKFRASVGVPLFKNHRLVAVMAAHSAAPRRWTDAEISLIQDVGERIAAEIERAHAEVALRESEERFRKALEMETVGVIFFDPDGAITRANDAFLRMGRYSRVDIEAARLRWDTLTPLEWMPASWRAIEEFKTYGQTTPYEKEYYRPDGSRWWGLFAAKRLSEHEGVEFILDITTRKQAEHRMQTLRRLTADLSARLTMQDMGKSILQTCREVVGGTRASLFHFITEQHALERVFTEGVFANVQDQHTRLSLEIATPLSDALQTRHIVWGRTQADYMQRYPHLHDEIIKHNVHGFIAVPLVLDQRILGAIAISFSQPKDLSDEEHDLLIAVAHLCAQALERARLYETEREAREAAEKANDLKMQFLGMISHELRTPLASIKGFTTTLLATDVTFDSKQQQQFLEVIDQETDKLTDLVVQLLDLTRLQAGTFRIDLSSQSPSQIITMAQTELKTLTTRHRLEIDIPADLPWVSADGQRVAQVLVNLVGNATKFSPPESPITIRAFSMQNFVQIEVSDEGLGIPLEHRMEVFEAFRQVERLTTNHDPGAGLGLAICKGIVEAHGGQIWVQDQDKGTTVSFTLSRAREN